MGCSYYTHIFLMLWAHFPLPFSVFYLLYIAAQFSFKKAGHQDALSSSFSPNRDISPELHRTDLGGVEARHRTRINPLQSISSSMYAAAWAQKKHCTSREYDLAHCSSFLCRLIYSVLIRGTRSELDLVCRLQDRVLGIVYHAHDLWVHPGRLFLGDPVQLGRENRDAAARICLKKGRGTGTNRVTKTRFTIKNVAKRSVGLFT